MRILVLHGPNLNLLGAREPEIYGTTTLAEIDARLREIAEAEGHVLESFQSNHEGDLVDKLQSAARDADGVVINPAAFSHYSLALRDAVEAIEVPVVEVHLSNIYAREPFRRRSVLSGVCVGVVAGFGVDSYVGGLRLLISRLTP